MFSFVISTAAIICAILITLLIVGSTQSRVEGLNNTAKVTGSPLLMSRLSLLFPKKGLESERLLVSKIVGNFKL